MPVKIYEVINNSLADLAGIKAGMQLVSINENEINDVLDYEFYVKDKNILLYIKTEEKILRKISIKKSEYQDLGLKFETYLMDKQHSCKNKCIFCFIDQLPKGLRESLYFKDDDERLSFLFGNYITLTNLSEKEAQRIIKLHISPVNVSVHTINKELRVKMMGNRFAGEKLNYLYSFAKAGIKINCQLVLCPGINDGEELKYSLNELEKLLPSLNSVAVVPVGVTKFRKGLYKLSEFNEISASNVIDIVNEFGEKFKNKYKKRLVYAADEFYIKARKKIPEYSYYDEFSQLENGVGMMALMKHEFDLAIKNEESSNVHKKSTIITGVAAYSFIKNLVDEVKNKWHNLDCQVIAINNDFFGITIDVTGLITGKNIINQLKNIDLGDELIIPSVMLRKEQDMFLDNITVSDIEKELNIKVKIALSDGAGFLYVLID